MPLEVVDVLVRDVLVPNDPIESVVVRVYDVTGTTLVTTGTTDGTGHVSFMLDGDDPATRYQLRTYLPGISIPQPRYVDIFSPAASAPTGANNFILNAEVHTLPPAVNPLLCRLSGYVRDAAGRPKRGIDIHFIHRFNPLIVGADPDSAEIVLGERVATRSDRNGYIEIDLWRNGCYRAVVESHENAGRDVHVPDATAANIGMVLFPRVHSVVFDPPAPWSIAVGQALTVSVQVLLTSGYVIDGTAPEDVEYIIPGGSVAAALEVTDNALILRGTAAGAATLSVRRYDSSVSYFPDEAVVGDGSVISVV